MTGATVAILDVGAMHVGSDQQAGGVCNKLTLAAFDFLATSRPRGPPASVVFDRLAVKTPAEGLGARPAASRACSSSSEIDPLQHPAVPPSQEIMLNHCIAGDFAAMAAMGSLPRASQPVRLRAAAPRLSPPRHCSERLKLV
jgi:hypothetical protein